MRTNRIKVVVLIVFVLTLGAGVVAGLLAARLPTVPVTTVVPPADPSSLSGLLSLTPEQSEKMRKIWEGVRDLSNESLAGSSKAEHDRDEAIRALIPKEKTDDYNAILQKYQDINASLIGKRKAAFDKAVKETGAILNKEQREKYLDILKKRLGSEFDNGHDPLGIATPMQPNLK